MRYSKKIHSDAYEIALTGNFTNSSLTSFAKLIDDLKALKPKELIFEMTALKSIDSSALGILLVFREAMLEIGGKVILRNQNEFISQTLQLGNFDELFDIE